jgi:Biotin-lipoyl like/HlyD family secretion protein
VSEIKAVMQERPDRRLQSLAVCMELERRLRQVDDLHVLAYQLVNDTHELVPYRQAILWQQAANGSKRLLAVSGLATADANAPFTLWMQAVGAELAAADAAPWLPRVIVPTDLSVGLAADWHEWLPAHALWLPLQLASDGRAGLLLAREDKWLDADAKLLSYLADAAGHAWRALGKTPAKNSGWTVLPRRRPLQIVVAVLIVLALLPVSQTALAPAEIIARDPILVRAPLDGVVAEILVQPNQAVSNGQALLTLDTTRLSNQLEVARQSLQVAEEELRQAQQQGFIDSRANAGLALLRGKVDGQRTEVNYLSELEARINIKAPRDGIIIFSDVNDWLGRPVSLGERIMEVADPAATEIEVMVPVSDAISFEQGARIRIFLNIDPLRPVEAELRLASYQASMTAEGVLAYRLVATIAPGTEPLRIGLKGTAKLYGERTLLIFHVLRRPLQTVRQWLGL